MAVICSQTLSTVLPLYLRCLIIRPCCVSPQTIKFTAELYVRTPLSHASPINRTKCTHPSNESNTDEHVTPCHQPNLRQRVFCTLNLIIPPLTAVSLKQIATKNNSKPTVKQKYPRFRRAVCYNAAISGCYPRYCVPLFRWPCRCYQHTYRWFLILRSLDCLHIPRPLAILGLVCRSHLVSHGLCGV